MDATASPLLERAGPPGALSDHLTAVRARGSGRLRRAAGAGPARGRRRARRRGAGGDRRRGCRAGDEEVRWWIRSYVLDGGAGSVCIHEATSPEALRKHAALANLPADEIIAVADTVLVRPDPAPAAA